MGGADGAGGDAHARDSSLHFVPLRMTKYCTCGTRFFVILRRPLSPVILRSAATKDLALARSPDRAITQGWRAEVVAQASFSWPFGPIHLLAPYEGVSPLIMQALARTSPSRRWRGDPPPLEGEAGWVVQMASVVARKRGILRCGLRPPLRMTK